MNAYQLIKNHVEAHVYKRGAFVGEAPVTKRSKTHFRAGVDIQCAYIVFHHTKIIRAYPDGRVVLDTSGWHSSPTTRDAMWEASHLCGFRARLFSDNQNGYKNPCVMVNGVSYVFYDGMEFDDRLALQTPPRRLKAYRSDKAARNAWDEKAAPFKAVFPILFSSVEPSWVPRVPIEDPEAWPVLASGLKREYRHHDTWQAVWAAFRRDAHKRLVRTVELSND